jgi:hypothetical protein
MVGKKSIFNIAGLDKISVLKAEKIVADQTFVDNYTILKTYAKGCSYSPSSSIKKSLQLFKSHFDQTLLPEFHYSITCLT